MKKVALAAVAAGLTGLVAAASGHGGSTATALHGTVGPGFTIQLSEAGKTVKTLAAGTYRITVSDRSPEHNFMLRAGSATPRQLTAVGFTGTKTYTVKLTKGTWTFFCAPHASAMFGRFGVGGPASAAAAPPPVSGDDDGDDDGGSDGDD
jgi:plastocyanin